MMMKPTRLALIGAFTFAMAAAQATGNHRDEARPQRGGAVSVVNDVSYELVATKDAMALYVSDHGKPVDLAGATAKLTLLAGAKKEELVLQPAGGALEAKGAFSLPPGTKALAQVQMKGKPAQTVRFTLR